MFANFGGIIDIRQCGKQIVKSNLRFYLIVLSVLASSCGDVAFAKPTISKSPVSEAQPLSDLLASADDQKGGADKKTSADDKDDDSATDKNSGSKEAPKATKAVKGSKPAGKSASADDDDAPAAKGKSFSGNVSWYGIPFHGRKTASGEIFDMNKMSAAHLKLPLPSRALVEDPRSGNAVIVRVNDRGPYCKTRVMDLSREAGRKLGILSRGVGYADITILQQKASK